jgi:uncharacterized repeat protein (TIGR01451 family)
VTDTLPAGATYVSATPSQGSCTGTSTVSCNLGTINNGGNATVTIVVTPTAAGTLNNTASVTSTTGDPNLGNNSSSTSTTVNPSADLSITKSDSPDPVVVGQNLTYSITVTNNGPTAASAVTVTDTLPGSVTFVSATPSQGSCTPSAGTVTCNVGSLAFPGSATISIVVTPTATGTISNSASVASTTNDPNNGNNSVGPVDTTVNGSADLSITKSDSPDPVLVGQPLTYTITVTNNGPTSASAVTVTDTLPGGVTFGSATPSQGTCSGTSTVTCNLGSLAFPGSATVTIVVTPTAAGTLNNSASVSSTTSDPNNGNNTAGPITTTVNAPSANLSITKTDSPDPVTAGNQLTYSISVTNLGPDTAAAVTVTDTLPASVTWVSSTPSQGSCSGTSTVTCNLGSLAFPGSATVTIVVTPNTAGSLSNTATVASSTTDPTPGNNSSTATTTVDPPTPTTADLVVTQVVTPDPVDVGLQATFTITVTNNGPANATAVVLTNTLPSNVTFDSATPSQGTCGAPSGGVFTCNLGSIANGGFATITLIVTTQTAGLIGNSASASGNESDPTPPNNTASVTTNVGDVTRLINISTRGFVATNQNILVGGFVLGGNVPKQLLIRGFGPTLAPAVGPGVLADPVIELYADHDNNPLTPAILILTNDNWGTDPTSCPAPAVACGTAQDIQNTGRSANSYAPTIPTRHLDAALLVTLPPGAYTVNLYGANSGQGVGLIGINDIDGTTLPKLVNISTRGLVLTGDNVMVGGFIIGGGGGPRQVLIRGFGPTLAGAVGPGVLSDPVIELYADHDNNPLTPAVLIMSNDNWGTDPPTCPAPALACGTAADILATGRSADSYAPTDPNRHLDSALLVTLPPGAYPVTLRGFGGGTGIGLVGVNDLGP